MDYRTSQPIVINVAIGVTLYAYFWKAGPIPLFVWWAVTGALSPSCNHLSWRCYLPKRTRQPVLAMLTIKSVPRITGSSVCGSKRLDAGRVGRLQAQPPRKEQG